MAQAVERLIQEYLDTLEQVHGKEKRKHVSLRWTGGTQVVIHDAANDERRLVDVGTLRMMTQYLRRAA